MVKEAYENGVMNELNKMAEAFDPYAYGAPKKDNTKRNTIIAGTALVGGGILARKQIGGFLSKMFKKDPTAKEISNAPVMEKIRSVYPISSAPQQVPIRGFKQGLLKRMFGNKTRRIGTNKSIAESAVVPVNTVDIKNPKISIPELEKKRMAAIAEARSQVSQKINHK
jgi:hypothetical protein